MMDLHKGRGPRPDRAATALAALAALLFSASVFTEGLGGPEWLRSGLQGLSIAAAGLSVWRAARRSRRTGRRS